MRWPWHHKHKAKKNIAAVPQTIQGIQLSSSAVGSAIPLVYGQARVAARLIHYKKLTLGAGSAGGLPAGSDDPNNAAIAMALCEGPIAGVLKAFDDKDQTDSVNDVFLPGVDFTPGSTTALTLRQSPIAGSVFLQFPRSGLAISTVVGSVVNFTGAIPIGTTAVVLTYQITGSLAARGFATFLGTLSQAAWSYLTTNYSAEAIPYELTAYMANPSWPVPNQQLANWSFEVQALLQWGAGIVDSNPKDIVTDFLTDANHGVGFPSALLATLTNFRDYCTAAGIFLSPVYDTQAPAAQHLQELLAVANSAFVWSDGTLKIVPYGDQNITGNGVTFTANVTPLYNLTDDDFIAGEGEDPVHVTRRPQSDVYNMVQVEFDNRSYQYNGDIAEAKDQNSIELYGLKPAPVIKAPFIKDPIVARLVAQLALQRQIYIRNTYQFTLGFRYVLLEPMDLVTLTDSNLGLNQTTVRLTEVDENENGEFVCTAEEWPFGVATAAAYGSGSTTGAPTPTPVEKVPKMPEITGSFDTSGQLILNLSGDGRASKHIYVVRTDRIPTLTETRAGTLVSFAGQSAIATGIVVLAGATVYIGDLSYNWSGGESPLATAVFKREGSGTSAPPVALIAHLNTEIDDTKWDLQLIAIAGSGGGGANLTWVATVKIGFATEVTFASGNGTVLPSNQTINRDSRADKVIRFTVTDTATGLISLARITVPSQRDEVTQIGGQTKFKRTVNFDDLKFALQATENDGTTKASSAHNPQGSIQPIPSSLSIVFYNSGGPASGKMWVAFSWSAFSLFRADGTTLSVLASTSLATPPTPTLSQVAGGALGARTLFVRIGYIKNNLMVRVGPEASLAVLAGNLLRVTDPGAVAGYDSWVALVGSSSNGEFIQAGTNFGNNFNEPTVGFNSTTTTPYDNTFMPNGVTAYALASNPSSYYFYPWYDIVLAFIVFPSPQLARSDSSAAAQNGDGRIGITFGGSSVPMPTAGLTGSGSLVTGKLV